MSASPSQRWSGAVHDLFACARGRLPPSFLQRKLADLGLTGIAPLANKEVGLLDKAVDLVNALADGRPAPGGKKPDEAMAEAFAEAHPTMGALRVVAQEYIASMRPAKANKARPPAETAPAPARGGRPPFDRRDAPAPRPQAPPPAPSRPRVTWEQWSEQHFPSVQPSAPSVAVTGEATAAAAQVAPAPAPNDTPAPFIPPALVHWSIDTESKQQLIRIRERLAATIVAKAEPASSIRELVFLILRVPQAVRDDLRLLLAEYLQRHGVTVTTGALYPPPPLASMRRDWENLLEARGAADPSVEGAWRKMVEAHPEVRAKLEAERTHECDDMFRRFAAMLRDFGEADARTIETRGRLESRHANLTERITAEIARVRALVEAAATARRLVAEHGWEHAESAAAIAGLDQVARQQLDAQRRHELDGLDRALRNASREHGPDADATRTALEQLCKRFPVEGAAATARIERVRRGEHMTTQERERRESGASPSAVHGATTEHRVAHVRAVPSWRLVVAVTGARQGQHKDGKESARRVGAAVGWLTTGVCASGPVAPGWRAADCGSLDELDACVQAVVDRDGAVIGVPLADCPERGGVWADAAWMLAAVAGLALPIEGACELAVELPPWAELGDAAACDAAMKTLSTTLSTAGRICTITRIPSGSDHAAALIEAVAWSLTGRKDSDAARIRQSGLDGACLLHPSSALREAVHQLAAGQLPTWPAWSTLLAASSDDALAAALVARLRTRLITQPEAIIALQRHLVGQVRTHMAEPARLANELAWLDGLGSEQRPRERLRLDGAIVAAQAAAGRCEQAALERLNNRLAELREEWPADVLEAALHATVHLREALDADRADEVLAPWAKAEAVACGGRALLVRLCEERARIAATSGRWKEARKQIDRGAEVAARLADPADRTVALTRLGTLKAAVLADDSAVADDEARAAITAALNGAEPITAAAKLAVDGLPRQQHLALLRWAVRRQEEVVAVAYVGKRAQWCEPREASASIMALRAVLLAPTDADSARALLLAAAAEHGDGSTTAQRLSLLACAVGAALHGAALPDLRDRLTALRRDRPLATPAVDALERALGLAPDIRAGLAEALPLLAR